MNNFESDFLNNFSKLNKIMRSRRTARTPLVQDLWRLKMNLLGRYLYVAILYKRGLRDTEFFFLVFFFIYLFYVGDPVSCLCVLLGGTYLFFIQGVSRELICVKVGTFLERIGVLEV